MKSTALLEKRGPDMRTQLPQDKTGHTETRFSYRKGTGRAPPGERIHCNGTCSPRPVTGQADRGISQPSSFLTADYAKRRRAFIKKGDRLAYTVTDASRGA